MQNKTFWVVLIGGLVSVVTLVLSIAKLVPSFLFTIVIGIYGLSMFYVSR